MATEMAQQPSSTRHCETRVLARLALLLITNFQGNHHSSCCAPGRQDDPDFPATCAAWFSKSKSCAWAVTLTISILELYHQPHEDLSSTRDYDFPPILFVGPPSPHCSMVGYLLV